jgi:hypothetical protein
MIVSPPAMGQFGFAGSIYSSKVAKPANTAGKGYG